MLAKKRRPHDFFESLPQAVNKKNMMFRPKCFEDKSIIVRGTKIREEVPFKGGKRVELDVDRPVQYLLYDKMDPTLRDIRNDVGKKKKRPRTTLERARKKRRRSALDRVRHRKTNQTAITHGRSNICKCRFKIYKSVVCWLDDLKREMSSRSWKPVWRP